MKINFALVLEESILRNLRTCKNFELYGEGIIDFQDYNYTLR
jgi:hypothetical protein